MKTRALFIVTIILLFGCSKKQDTVQQIPEDPRITKLKALVAKIKGNYLTTEVYLHNSDVEQYRYYDTTYNVPLLIEAADDTSLFVKNQVITFQSNFDFSEYYFTNESMSRPFVELKIDPDGHFIELSYAPNGVSHFPDVESFHIP